MNNVVIVKIGQALNSGHLHSGITIGEGLYLQQQHQSGNLLGYLLTYSAGMRHNQVFLQQAQILL